MADQVELSGDLRCAIITPDCQVLDVAATSVIIPAHDGQIGILRQRAPLLCNLGIGVVKLTTGGTQRRVFIDGGFAEVRDSRVTVLTAAALEPEQIDRETSQAALNAALNMRITDDASFQARQDAIARAKTQLALTRG